MGQPIRSSVRPKLSQDIADFASSSQLPGVRLGTTFSEFRMHIEFGLLATHLDLVSPLFTPNRKFEHAAMNFP